MEEQRLTNHYHIQQGPGKALKVITHLDKLIGKVNIENSKRKADDARIAFEKMLGEMKEEDVLALYASLCSLLHIVRSAEITTLQDIDSRWGLEVLDNRPAI